jgi:hypothetical protein
MWIRQGIHIPNGVRDAKIKQRWQNEQASDKVNVD